MSRQPSSKDAYLLELAQGDSLHQALGQAARDVFEDTVLDFNQAVMVPSSPAAAADSSDGGTEAPIAAGSPDRVEINTEARVSFEGPISGQVLLRCSAEGAEDIARGLLMMGEDECLKMDEVDDALGECANLIAGSLKTRALDPHGEFQLGLPQLRHDAAERMGHSPESCVYHFSEGHVALEIWINSEAAPQREV